LQPGGIAREAPSPSRATSKPSIGELGAMRGGRGAGDYWNRQPEGAGGDVGASDVVAASGGRSLPQILLSQLPQAGELPKAGLLDKILSGVAMGGSIYGAIGSPGMPRSGGANVPAPNTPRGVMNGVRF
jgi:hypothetical protein